MFIPFLQIQFYAARVVLPESCAKDNPGAAVYMFSGVCPTPATAKCALSRVVEGSISGSFPGVAAPGDLPALSLRHAGGRTALITYEVDASLFLFFECQLAKPAGF